MGRGAVLHASAAEVNGQGIVFTAPSGGGKTTAVMLLNRHGFKVIGEDSTVVCRGTDGVWRIFPCASWTWQTGDERSSLELRHIVFLEKGEPGSIISVDPVYAAYRVLRDTLMMAYGDLEHREREPLRHSVREICGEFPSHVLRYSRPEGLPKLLRSVLH
jgi:hypothetical protein